MRESLAARRKARGFTQEKLAQALHVTTSAVARWEQGTSTPTARHRPPLAEALGTSLAELDVLLADEDAPPNSQQVVPEWLTLYASLEQGSSQVWAWQPVTIHALLQTPEYATAVESMGRDATADRVAQKVALRVSRQRVLRRKPEPLRLSVVLDESCLWRVTGGRDVMAAQLDHLADMAERPNVELRILPLDPGVHVGGFGTFTVLSSPGAPAHRMVCVEDRTGQRYLEAAHAVELHTALFNHLCELALAPEDSLQMVRGARRKYE